MLTDSKSKLWGILPLNMHLVGQQRKTQQLVNASLQSYGKAGGELKLA